MGDYKSFLFMWCAKNKRTTPEVTFRIGGVNQNKRFICEITMNDFNYVAVGNSTNKKDAQLNAARDYVLFLVRSNIVSENEVKTNLRNEGSEILGGGNKSQPLALNKPNVSVFKAGVGPQSLGVAYQPVMNRQTIDFSVLDKRTVDEQETLDVNAAVHGNWTVNEAKNRLNQFMQMNKIKAEYKYSFIGPDNAKTFIAELSIFVPQLGRKITGRESGSSKMAASKSCALSLIRQLFHLGVVERCCTVTGTAPRHEQMPSYPVTFEPELLERIRICVEASAVDWDSCLKEASGDGVLTLLAGRQAEQPEDDKKKGRVVTWSPPQANWDPWRGANIDDTNPNLASASMDNISDELQKVSAITNADRDRIQRERKQLPIFTCKNKILNLIEFHPVVIIKGATGCGKTTQVCQYILDSWIQDGKGAECNIVITQPRRISAISVAERVSRERYEDMGDSVGYSVRFETVLPRPYGSMMFCTVGVLLRKLEIGLRGISHVIVDEIHERDVNTDFLLVVLRDTLHVYPDLRVILMSATVDTEMFSTYFNNCPVIEVPGRCFDVHTIFLEDAIEMLNFKAPLPNKKKTKSEPADESDEEELSDNYQQSTKDSLALLDDKEIPFELIHEILLWCRRRGDGAVLIFLPGWSTIFSLMKRLLYSHEFRKPYYIILPLHSQLPREEQRLVFEEPPRGVTKIILATNIAESSITINDVVYVIDCCKVKVKMFTSHNNMIHYATVWASRSNMEQRGGRAGRTANGFCFRLCTKSRYSKIEEHIVAEMLRTSLEELALNIKLLGLGSVSHFLSKALEPPPLDAVIEAQVLLKEMYCLDDNYDLTTLGRLIAKLPLEPRLARMLIMGCIMELGDAATTIASNVSLASEVFDIEIAMSGRQRWFAGTRCSDQLAMLNAFQRFTALETRGLEAQQEFTCVNELSFPALVITGEAKAQIKDILFDCCFPQEALQPLKFNFGGEDTNLDLMAALLTIGSYPNVCYHKERRKVLTTESKPALIIKTSVNCSKFQTNFPTPFFVYNEKLRTKTVYCKTLGMVTPVHLLLFGCNQVEVTKNIVKLDGWIYLEMDAKSAALVLSLRPLLESIVTKVASSPVYIFQMSDSDKEILTLVKKLCEFNSGRYNLPQYIMSKDVKVNTQWNPENTPMMAPPPTEAVNMDYSMEQYNSSDLKQNTSFSGNSNYSYAGDRSGVSEPNEINNSNAMECEAISCSDNTDLKNVNETDVESLPRPSDPKKMYKIQSEGVKTDPNSSRAALSNYQQRPASASVPKPANPPDGPDQRMNEGTENQDDPYQHQNFKPNRGAMNRNGQTYLNQDPRYRWSQIEPFNYGNPYNDQTNFCHDQYAYPRPSFRPGYNHRGNPRSQSMYGSANYYKQRYTQYPNNHNPNDHYGRSQMDGSYDHASNGRRYGSRGRGMYPPH